MFNTQRKGRLWEMTSQVVEARNECYPLKHGFNIKTDWICIKRMDENELTRRIMGCNTEGIRMRGLPKLWWMDGTNEDLSKLKNGGWTPRIGIHGGRSWRKSIFGQDCSAEDDLVDKVWNGIYPALKGHLRSEQFNEKNNRHSLNR